MNAVLEIADSLTSQLCTVTSSVNGGINSAANDNFARISNGVVTWLHKDHLGSATVATSANGLVSWREQYKPFGETMNNLSINNDLDGFTGHIKDSATGLTYMQARYYDPSIGRFLSRDPINFTPQRTEMFGRYTYVNNDPVNLTDPTGMEKREIKREYTITGSRIKQTATITVEAGDLTQEQTESLLSVVSTKFFRANDGKDLSSYQKHPGGPNKDKADVIIQVIGRAIDTHGNSNLKKAWARQKNIWASDKPDPYGRGAYARANDDGKGFQLFKPAFQGGNYPSSFGTTNLLGVISHELHHNTHPFWFTWHYERGGGNYNKLHGELDAASRAFLKGAGMQ